MSGPKVAAQARAIVFAFQEEERTKIVLHFFKDTCLKLPYHSCFHHISQGSDHVTS